MAWLSIDPFTWKGLFYAFLCASIIGVERELKGKAAGLRTSILIILGTYVFIRSSFAVATELTDPTRIVGQVVTGIGFLGAGVMLTRHGEVLGVTSAAIIWALASIGVCIGVGYETTAFKLTLLILVVLVVADKLEKKALRRRRRRHIKDRQTEKQGEELPTERRP